MVDSLQDTNLLDENQLGYNTYKNIVIRHLFHLCIEVNCHNVRGKNIYAAEKREPPLYRDARKFLSHS